jgi:hypothetical protein
MDAYVEEQSEHEKVPVKSTKEKETIKVEIPSDDKPDTIKPCVGKFLPVKDMTREQLMKLVPQCTICHCQHNGPCASDEESPAPAW